MASFSAIVSHICQLRLTQNKVGLSRSLFCHNISWYRSSVLSKKSATYDKKILMIYLQCKIHVKLLFLEALNFLVIYSWSSHVTYQILKTLNHKVLGFTVSMLVQLMYRDTAIPLALCLTCDYFTNSINFKKRRETFTLLLCISRSQV